MAASIRVTDDLPKLQPMFKRLAKLGGNPEPLLAKIASYGESSTRERFSTQKSPDGQRWKPSLRAQLRGGKTLTKDTHLGDSITPSTDGNRAQWGSNRIYAAIHQFGGTITPKNSSALRFQIPGLGWITRKSVTLPARPFLGISSDDLDEIMTMVRVHIRDLTASTPGGA